MRMRRKSKLVETGGFVAIKEGGGRRERWRVIRDLGEV